ncbi:hypothetical protein [Riemerella columbipharyngis]|uniref:Uncharacterized protein n=1 Tax=Riemerella columbipharyngis TaxID=1071918 RepID=A0A1G7DX00_9FLAO|nr:hypothetical protein [Riemerella columbipharyngis]SDE55941.1 hypothetical protein SAMN05421544_11312 [Riemerella columbipharyngis]
MNQDYLQKAETYSQDMVLDAQAQSYLLTAAKWAKFLAIIGFVFIAIGLIVGLAFSTVASSAFSEAIVLGNIGYFRGYWRLLYYQ